MQRPILFTAAERQAQTTPWGRRTRVPLQLGPILPVVLAFVLGILAYQWGAHTVIAIGSLGDQVVIESSQALGAEQDRLGKWYPDEQDRGSRYRWSRENARIVLPGLGAGTGTVQLQVAGWPEASADQQPTVTVLQGDNVLGSFKPTGDYQTHTFALPATSTADRTVWLRSDAALTSADDPRPKGIRLNRIELVTSGGVGLAPGWGAVLALVATTSLSTLAVTRRTHRASLSFLWGVGCTVLLSTLLVVARIWTVAATPWLTILAAVAYVLVERRSIKQFWRAWSLRWRWNSALDYALLVVLLLATCLAVAAVVGRLSLPSVATLRNNPALLEALVPLLFVLLLIVVAGPTLLPRGLHILRQQLIVGRLAWVLLLSFAVIWIGWEWTVLGTVPVVGHADYADNAVVARSLIRGQGWLVPYVTQFYDLRPAGLVSQPQPTWPLLQPVWIAPFMALLGPTALAARLPNLVFNLLLALLIFRIGAAAWDRRVGLLAAMLTLLNEFFFRLTLFATSDLAFVVLSMSAIWLFFRATERTYAASPVAGKRHRRLSTLALWALAGLLMGLMVLQKPSGAVFGAGMVGWTLLRWRRSNPLPWRGLLVWGAVAALVITPYVVRNELIFGKLVASTESVDAWILHYEGPTEDVWAKLYDVYVGDVPNPTWILRWGWDRTLSKLAVQVDAGIKFLLPPKGYLLGLPLTCLALASIPLLHRRQRSLLGLVGLVGLGYGSFLVLYWHLDGEERYLLPFVPWLLLLAMGGVCTIYDRLAALHGGRWSGLVGLMLSLTLVVAIVPHWRKIDERLDPSSSRYVLAEWQPSLNAFAWLRDNTAPDAVVMSRVPWQLAFYADRPGVMIPNEPLPTILGIGKYYHAQYLLLNSTSSPGPQAAAGLAPLAEATEELAVGQQLAELGFTLVHREPAGPDRRPVLVYRFPAEYVGAGTIR